MKNKKLTNLGSKVLEIIFDEIKKNGECSLTSVEISKRLDCSRRSAQKHLKIIRDNFKDEFTFSYKTRKGRGGRVLVIKKINANN